MLESNYDETIRFKMVASFCDTKCDIGDGKFVNLFSKTLMEIHLYWESNHFMNQIEYLLFEIKSCLGIYSIKVKR